jgi:hypothetical protein
MCTKTCLCCNVSTAQIHMIEMRELNKKQHVLLPPLRPPVIGFDGFAQMGTKELPGNFGSPQLMDEMVVINL